MNKIFLAIMISLAWVSASFCQESTPPLTRFDKSSPLSLTIACDKAVYGEGESIVLTLTWTNPGEKDLQIAFREDSLLQAMSFKDADGRELLKGQVLIESAPEYKTTIAAGKTYSYQLNGSTSRQKFPLSKGQPKRAGDLVLKFDGAALSQIPVLLGKPRKFFVIAKYEMPADSYLARKEPDIWTGTIISNRFSLEVGPKTLAAPVLPANVPFNGSFSDYLTGWTIRPMNRADVTTPDQVLDISRVSGKNIMIFKKVSLRSDTEVVRVTFRARKVFDVKRWEKKTSDFDFYLKNEEEASPRGFLAATRRLPDNGAWENFEFTYRYDRVPEYLVINIQVWPGDGRLQFDDFKVQELKKSTEHF